MLILERYVVDDTEDRKNDVIEESGGDEQITARVIGGTDRGSYWYWQMIRWLMRQGVLDDKEGKGGCVYHGLPVQPCADDEG